MGNKHFLYSSIILITKIFLSFLLLLSLNSFGGELSFKISPYIQQTSSTGLRIRWERKIDDQVVVRVGKLNSENELEFYPVLLRKEFFRLTRKKTGLYETVINGLLPNTSYYYQLISEEDQSSIYNFKTLNDSRENFSFLVLADAQHGHEVTTKIVNESVIYHSFLNNPDKEKFPPRFSLFPGDLVQHGILKSDWRKHFFNPLAPLLHRLAIYPVKGNHEMGRYFFNQYFSLPRQTSDNPKFNYYFFDYSNIRFINLDTNVKYRNKRQLRWLDQALKEANKDSEIDFIIAQFHHPHKSEAWTWGNTKFSGEIEQVLVEASKKSSKPIIYFNGHTHAYSRGHMLNSRVTMITVGPIGGAIDYWDRGSKDYPLYHKTVSQYGWATVRVNADDDPSIEVVRYGFGDKHEFRDTGVIDRFKIYRNSPPPEKPSIVEANLDRRLLKATLYENREAHLTTQVKVTYLSKRGKQNQEVFTYNRENIFNGKDNNTTKDLTLLPLNLRSDKAGHSTVQVRYRNESMVWSEWSEKYSFPSERD